MDYIMQAGDDDCGVAVLAMLTGRSLDETIWWMSWSGRPLKPHEMYHWLWKDGYYLRSLKLRTEWPSWNEGDEWPPAPFQPFAEAHYLMVTATKGGHWVAIDDGGKLLDPWDASRDSLSCYSAIHEIVGVIGSRDRAPVAQ